MMDEDATMIDRASWRDHGPQIHHHNTTCLRLGLKSTGSSSKSSIPAIFNLLHRLLDHCKHGLLVKPIDERREGVECFDAFSVGFFFLGKLFCIDFDLPQQCAYLAVVVLK